jgi:hypothetical protein
MAHGSEPHATVGTLLPFAPLGLSLRENLSIMAERVSSRSLT